MNPLLAAIQAGALAVAEGLINRGAAFEAVVTRLVESFGQFSVITLADIADIAERGMRAGDMLSQLPAGELLNPKDVPLVRGLDPRALTIDVAVDYRGPDGLLDSSLIEVQSGREIDYDAAIEAAELAVERGTTGSPPIPGGASDFAFRIVGVYRGG